MHQNLLNAEFASVLYQNDQDENVHEDGVIKPLTKVLHKSFCCTYAYHELHFRVKWNGTSRSYVIFLRKSGHIS